MKKTLSPHSKLLIHDVRAALTDPRRGASKRLAICASLIGFFSLVYLALWTLIPTIRSAEVAQDVGFSHIINYIILFGVFVSFAIFLIARTNRLSTVQTLDLGLVYEVLLGLMLGVAIKLVPGPMRMPNLWSVSEICILILIFPAIVPHTPRKMILASLIVASCDPAGVYLAGWLTGKEIPPTIDLFYAYVPNYISAFLVLIPAVVIERLGHQVDQAREMGSYRLIELLGKGGMGEVWRATHRLLARDAAVKIIKPENLGPGNISETMQARFEREAQATANLHSHNTVQLYDFGVTPNGVLFLVTELLSGLDLETFITRFGPISEARAIYLLRQICDSLEDAHRSDLIHRDIKPANIFSCRYGLYTDYIKVLDFGLVRMTSRSEEDAGLTIANTITGTPAYMAPEMTLSSHHVDARADIYSLGCVAYWLVTGHQLFERDAPLKVLGAHLKDEPIPPSQSTEIAISPEFERIILSCLAKDPADRPQSARLLSDLLERCDAEAPWTAARSDEWWDTHLPN